jgi:hypothetical protein
MNAHTKLPARETLRVAIATRDKAAIHLREAAATMARAGRLATEAQRRLDVLGDVDGEVLAHATAAYRTFAEAGGERPAAGIPAHLAEKQRHRDAARQELAAAEAARSQLTEEHAAAQGEHERREREVLRATDSVIAEESISIYVRYVQAIEAARAAFDDMAAISSMTVQTGPRWVDRTPLPGLPPLVARAVSMGFGHRDEPPPGERRDARRSAEWDDLRRRLRRSADEFYPVDERAIGSPPQISAAMISVAVEVLWNEPLLDVSESLAEVIAEKILRRALSTRHEESRTTAPTKL